MTTTSTITTGTVATAGSTTYISGASSGIDTDALVTAGYNAKLAAADTIDVKITNNDAVVAAYQNLQSLGTALTTSLDSLKTTYGYLATDKSVYNTLTSYLASSDGNDVSNYMSVTVDSTAEKSSYNVSIEQIATTMKVASTSQASKTTALGIDGSFSLQLDEKTSVDIAVTSTMTLSDIASSINSVTATTGVKASIIKVSDSAYSLVLSGSETGQEIQYSSTSGTDIFASLGVTNASGSYTNITQAAQDAKITIDGMEITSSSNTLENVLDGVSITLYSAPSNSDTNITLEVDQDYSSTKTAIQSFIDAYNNLRDFFVTQKTTNTDGTASDTSVLFSDTLLKTLESSISSVLTGTFGNSDAISSLADLGITFDENNKLEISDETALNNALLNNYTDVQSLFQTSITTDSSNLSVLRNSSTQSDLNFDLDISVDENGTITGASVNGDTSAFTVSGTRIIGATGSKYEGITFVYIGKSSETVNVSFSQGLADRLYNIVNNYTNTTDGIVQEKVDRYSTLNNTMQIKSDRIKERAEAYRDKLIVKYAAMESAISSANSLLKQVKALLGNSDSSD